MAEIQTTLHDIAAAIVDSPDQVKVEREEDETTITLTLTVAPDDMGMVIGRHGRIAKAIRAVMKSAAPNCGKKVNVEFVSANPTGPMHMGNARGGVLGDTLANVFSSDYGNYSDGFRKAFHHEPISYMRRQGNEQVELLQPKLSTVLSGTPRQIASLIPDTENGLFSRFIFYYVDFKLTWLNVFASGNEMPFYCSIGS